MSQLEKCFVDELGQAPKCSESKEKNNVSCSTCCCVAFFGPGTLDSCAEGKNSEGSLSLLPCKSSAPDFEKENKNFADITEAGNEKETSFSVAFVINRGWEIKRENLDMTSISP